MVDTGSLIIDKFWDAYFKPVKWVSIDLAFVPEEEPKPNELLRIIWATNSVSTGW
ncbi:Uncharacterised protein [Vibrio cincinnatiensis]|jgi:hypothetical protein|uniref:Uncharacterized protein n=1 Tax=Vibrio cincinnatiensis DSM 19608 TaxID=1123491 RepID=A0A1T4N9Z2_VIBCI|nr:hypothetical protein SAMN02745782_01286 [Vibrio cincinnatiensis DSM 19608]SUP49148.1 Uncharacterised protein [Vibrio cincinnatiensis]